MRRWMGIALICVSVLFWADADLPAQQPSRASSQDQPAPAEPVAIPSQAEQQQIREIVAESTGMLRQISQQSSQKQYHDRLNQALTGDGLSPQSQQAFLEIFSPQRQTLHQLVDEDTTLLRRELEGRAKSSVSQSQKNHFQWLQPVTARTPELLTPGKWQLQPIAFVPLETFPHGENPYLQLIQAGSSSSSGISVTSNASEGVVIARGSGEQDGFTVSLAMEDWVDTDKTVAENGADLTFDIGKTVQMAAGQVGLKVKDHARVDRCPSADGIVLGKGKLMLGASASIRTSATTGSGSFEFTQEFVAEGHVADDALVKDVTVQVDLLIAKRGRTKFRDGTVYDGPLNFRFGGTTTFDPHRSDDTPPIQLTRCAWNKGLIPIDLCLQIMEGDVLPLLVWSLRKAYLKAEKKWNFTDDKRDYSKCVTAQFSPKSKTIRGRPNQSVNVKAELVTVDGRKPTEGSFDELEYVKGGSIQQNGARTTPGAPAPLTYTAPQQSWLPSDPPGFDVVKARSRAGAFMRDHASEDEYRWLLKPGFKLTIHDKWESRTPLNFLISEATFPINLMSNQRGDLFGQAVVSRNHRQVENAFGMLCQDTGQWTEVWQAYAVYDDKGENLTIKLRFQSSPKQGMAICPGAMAQPYTEPGVTSDQVRTPLDQFKMPAQDGATKQFVFNFGGITKTVIDVTLMPADGGGR